MGNFEVIDIMLVVVVFIGVIGLVRSIRNITESVYYFLFGVTNTLLTPITFLHNKLVSVASEKLQIKKLYKYGWFDAWGGPIQFFVGAVIAVLTLAAIIHQSLINPPIWDNADVLLRSPTFYLISLIDGESPFALSSITELCIFGAFAALCFREATELSGVRRYVYEIVFLLFSVLAPEYLPDWIYDIPEKLSTYLFEFLGAQSEGFLEVIKLILLIISITIIGYLLLLVYSIAVREIVANITFSLWPICVMFVIMLVFELLTIPESLELPLHMLILLITSFLFQRDRVIDDDEFVKSREAKKAIKKQERLQRKAKKASKIKSTSTLAASYFFGAGDKLLNVISNKLYVVATVFLTVASVTGILGGLFTVTTAICSVFMWQCYFAAKNKKTVSAYFKKISTLACVTYIILYIFAGVLALASILLFLGSSSTGGDVAPVFLVFATIVFFINFCCIRKICAFTKSLSNCAQDLMGSGKFEYVYEARRALLILGVILTVFGISILAMGITITNALQIIMAVSVFSLVVCFGLVARLIKKSFLINN